MHERPLVSVITAFYNPGAFLQEAIESVLAQSYKDWEYWLVNDGSTDGSEKIAHAAALAHPNRIHCLEHANFENRGVCSSRNLGLQHARGDYIALLDADDYWLPQKLQEQMALAQNFPQAGLIFGHSRYWSSWRQEGLARKKDYIPALAPADTLYEPVELIRLNYPLGPHGAPCPSDLLIKADVCRAIGGFEECFNRHQVFEDQAFLAKLYLSTHVYVSSLIWDCYRLHDNSCCYIAEENGSVDDARRVYLRWLRHYLNAREISDRRIWDLWERATLPYRHPHISKFMTLYSKLRRTVGKLTSKSTPD